MASRALTLSRALMYDNIIVIYWLKHSKPRRPGFQTKFWAVVGLVEP
jgi:hypothetical protein